MNRPAEPSIHVVVPTIREASIKRFIAEWDSCFAARQVRLIVVEDNPERMFDIDAARHGFPVMHCCWQDIEADLGRDEWIISRRDSAIKCYGFWKACQQEADVIIALDDDCYPLSNHRNAVDHDFLGTHLARLSGEPFEVDVPAWESTIDGLRPRGIPYEARYRRERIVPNDVIVNHGLWYNVPDLDAPTQLASRPPGDGYMLSKVISRGRYFPMCGMNLAFRAEAAPLFYFPLMGQDRNGHAWGFSRFDDIWAGIFMKRIADHLGRDVTSGEPAIWHDRASDVFSNLAKEARGIGVNEQLWLAVDRIELKSTTLTEAYMELAENLPAVTGDSYWESLRRAMLAWAALFQ